MRLGPQSVGKQVTALGKFHADCQVLPSQEDLHTAQLACVVLHLLAAHCQILPNQEHLHTAQLTCVVLHLPAAHCQILASQEHLHQHSLFV